VSKINEIMTEWIIKKETIFFLECSVFILPIPFKEGAEVD